MQKRFLSRATSDGHFDVPSRLRRFSLDVGFNQGHVTIGDWLLQKQNYDSFIIGIEANPYLHSLFDIITTQAQHPRDYEGLFWHAADSDCVSDKPRLPQCRVGYAVETAGRARIFQNYSDQLLLIHAAASSSMKGIADFHIGLEWGRTLVSDVGSIFEFTKTKGHKSVRTTKPVAFLRLGDVLARVPPPPRLHWDTLKIDIQGADADALLSAHEYLPRFMCVLGDFKTGHYNVPSNVLVNPTQLMQEAGFHMLHKDAHAGQLWAVTSGSDTSKRTTRMCRSPVTTSKSYRTPVPAVGTDGY